MLIFIFHYNNINVHFVFYDNKKQKFINQQCKIMLPLRTLSQQQTYK